MKKLLTLCLLVQNGRILLGMKKRGFGAGRWNGFGGKVGKDETIERAAIREVKEECGVDIGMMERCGVHEFRFENHPGEILEVHVFRTDTFAGEPRETEEMRPRWFRFEDIPYDEMWEDDRYWLPFFLEGKKFRTEFLFDGNEHLLAKSILIVERI